MVTPEQEAYYDELAARLTDPNVPVRSAGKVRTGAAAAAAGRAFMLKEYGSEEALEAAMRPDRPRVGNEKGARSPVVRGSITDEDYDAFERLRRLTGKSQSELVREAVHSYLVTHQRAS